MSDYINPGRKVIKDAFRAMSKTRLEFVCTKCAKKASFTLVQIQRGVKPGCPICGPGTLTRADKQAGSQT